VSCLAEYRMREYDFTPDLGVPALLLVLFYIVMHL
jgi:hypothetical protein